MKPNRYKQMVSEGKNPVGHMLFEFCTPGIAQMLEVSDVDFVIIDSEHTGFSLDKIADMVGWFKATTVAPFVRIPQIQYQFIARTLDVGALGLMVPNVKTGAEARAIVDAAKYAPMGNRGIMIPGSHTHFKSVNPREYMDYANENTTIICLIESVEGLDNLEDIASTPGVDILWVGHFDLTQSMGILAEFHHERFLGALRQVIDTAKKHGLGACIQPGSREQAKEWIEMGFNVISYNADIFLYIEAMTQAVSDMRELFKT